MTFETLRSTQQQLKDEFAADIKRMTDPEEQEKERMRKQREQTIEELNEDAGL